MQKDAATGAQFPGCNKQMTTESKGEAGGMDPRDDEALWALLGRQEPPTKAGPYFARRVLREITEEPRGGWWQRARQIWTLAPRYTAAFSGALALGVLCLSAVLTLPSGRSPISRVAASTDAVGFSTPAGLVPAPATDAPDFAQEVAPVQDEEVIADLDNLLSREESRLWTEDDTARF